MLSLSHYFTKCVHNIMIFLLEWILYGHRESIGWSPVGINISWKNIRNEALWLFCCYINTLRRYIKRCGLIARCLYTNMPRYWFGGSTNLFIIFSKYLSTTIHVFVCCLLYIYTRSTTNLPAFKYNFSIHVCGPKCTKKKITHIGNKTQKQYRRNGIFFLLHLSQLVCYFIWWRW